MNRPKITLPIPPARQHASEFVQEIDADQTGTKYTLKTISR